LEGSQGGCASVCEGVHDLSVEEVRAYTSGKTALVIAYSRAEVGDHFHRFHYRVVEGIEQGLYLRGG
jgi:hypothetical protein